MNTEKFETSYWEGAIFTRTSMAHNHSKIAAMFMIRQIETLLGAPQLLTPAAFEHLKATLKIVEEL